MAIVKPFKGLRPPKELVEEVEARPYDVLDSEEARIEAGTNEKSLYHIIKPEINFEPGISEYDPRVYESSRKTAGWYRTLQNITTYTPRPCRVRPSMASW